MRAKFDYILEYSRRSVHNQCLELSSYTVRLILTESETPAEVRDQLSHCMYSSTCSLIDISPYREPKKETKVIMKRHDKMTSTGSVQNFFKSGEPRI